MALRLEARHGRRRPRPPNGSWRHSWGKLPARAPAHKGQEASPSSLAAHGAVGYASSTEVENEFQHGRKRGGGDRGSGGAGGRRAGEDAPAPGRPARQPERRQERALQRAHRACAPPSRTTRARRWRSTAARLPGTDTEVVDSPGLNSLLPLSEDEQVTWDLVRSVRGEDGAVVVQVADAKNLRRALLLTLQLGQLEVPTVLVLNMHDEAEARGIRLDLRRARGGARHPGAQHGRDRGPRGSPASPVRSRTARVPRQPRADRRGRGRPGARLLLGGRAAAAGRRPPSCRATTRRCWRTPTRSRGATRPRARPRGRAVSRRLGRAGDPPASGAGPCWRSCSTCLYEFVGVFGAGTLVDLMENGLFHDYLNPWAMALFSHLPWAFARDLFVGEYGVVTMGLSYGLAIVLPIVLTFFTAFALLEDSGLPAAARGDERPRLPADGPERQGGAADGARPRLRHDGDADHAHPADEEGARAGDAAARARRAVLGAARRDPGDAGGRAGAAAAVVGRLGRAA